MTLNLPAIAREWHAEFVSEWERNTAAAREAWLLVFLNLERDGRAMNNPSTQPAYPAR